MKHIIDVMKQAEDLEDIKELHACCSCMQTIRKDTANCMQLQISKHVTDTALFSPTERS